MEKRSFLPFTGLTLRISFTVYSFKWLNSIVISSKIGAIFFSEFYKSIKTTGNSRSSLTSGSECDISITYFLQRAPADGAQRFVGLEQQSAAGRRAWTRPENQRPQTVDCAEALVNRGPFTANYPRCFYFFGGKTAKRNNRKGTGERLWRQNLYL